MKMKLASHEMKQDKGNIIFFSGNILSAIAGINKKSTQVTSEVTMYTEIRKLECQGTLANGLVWMNREEKCILAHGKN